MRYFVRAFVLFFVLGFILSAKSLANPGDTTWVQAQNDVQPDWYNDFDAPVTFPSGSVSYRKIIMIFDSVELPDGSAIEEIKANGNTTSKSSYSTKHKPSVHSAFYYYRLKLYYADGSWKYSNKVTLSPVTSIEYAVDVRPNPFDNTIIIHSKDGLKVARKIVKL